MNNEKVLLIGTGATAAPILSAIRDMGFFVGVIGGKRNDICHKLADASHVLDYSDPKNVESVFLNEKYQYIVPSCNDESYFSGSHVASKYDLPGYDSPENTRVIHNKKVFRETLQKFTSHSPRFQFLAKGDALNKALRLPLIVKPAESSTGKGINVVLNQSLLASSIETAEKVSRDGQVILEEFFSGSLHSVSMYFDDSKPKFIFFADEYCTDYEFAVNESNFPSTINSVLRSRMVEEICHIFEQLDLVDGLLHVQVLVDGDQFIIVEAMRRCPGDLYGTLIEMGSGFEYFAAYVTKFVGGAFPKKAFSKNRYICRQTLTAMGSRVFNKFKFDTKGRVIELLTLHSNGSELEDFPNDKQGVVFVEYDSEIDMYAEAGSLKCINLVV